MMSECSGPWRAVLALALLAGGISGCEGCGDVREGQDGSDSWVTDVRPDSRRGDLGELDTGKSVDAAKRDTDGGLAGWCPPTEPNPGVETADACGETLYGTAEQFGATPRPKSGMELLVLDDVDAFVAPQCLYDRVVGEVGGIRNGPLAEVDIPFSKSRFPDFGRFLTFHVDSDAADRIESGKYEWSCLNAHYEIADYSLSRQGEDGGGAARVVVELEGIYDMQRVAEAYENLPGLVEKNGELVQTVNPAVTVDTPQVDICVQFDGEASRYVFFAERLRDSPPGSVYYLFAVDGVGDVEQIDERRSDQSKNRPEWVSEVCG